MSEGKDYNQEKRIPNRWNPIPADYLLERYELGARKVITLLASWTFLFIASVISVMILMPKGNLHLSVGQDSIYQFFLIYPPLLIGTIAFFWYGFEWGFIPLFLSAFLTAFFTGMPFQWALLFGIAFVLGLAIYGLAYYSVSFDPGLRSLKDLAFFTVVSFVAAIASSMGSFVWSLFHNLSALDTLIIWKGWWTGVFLQSILLIAPLLYLLTPAVERFKKQHFEIPVPKVSINWIYSAIISMVVVLVIFMAGAKFLGTSGIKAEMASLPLTIQENILKSMDSFEIVSWISIGILLTCGIGGIYLVGSWNKSLQKQVAEKTEDLINSEASLKIALEEKEQLLKEINQRVKNNLTMVLALLELQSKTGSDKDFSEVLKDSHARLRSISIIYETLSQNDSLSRVNLKNYMIKLSNRLHQSFRSEQKDIDVLIDAEEIEIDIDRAVPFGMILNELLVNAYTFAFEGKQKGTIFLKLERVNGDIQLSVRDNGIGLPADFEKRSRSSLGMKLIKTLTQQLKGDFGYETDGKTSFTLSVPLLVSAVY
ncbi:MAG: histidine kinase dimerization/phosphoacceptor domain -containing protein [Balneolaceae bacterium]|nr:histidine kinase dimerization/phosphoacceptor domain -containing protein [Balneolaceae bacterium]